MIPWLILLGIVASNCLLAQPFFFRKDIPDETFPVGPKTRLPGLETDTGFRFDPGGK